ncbi:Predicted ATPase [Pseudonocardia ammonioxydans]|uniref:Predicted ATPase n=1 Tax=Pseudonocardia ammonioxydans TaxID=260086 RepID=A0A1I4TIT1_PSUAM|nr:AAA family ATPase [Pseudonocardia ammonioxydans]SFM76624.1 Predicted ATPase [Pseudonocardia ammonioxydans]
MPSSSAAGHFLARTSLAPDAPDAGYPFDLPVVRWLREHGGLVLRPGVTFLVGENGSGKSTLVEALAVALGLNPEGGSRSFRFATRSSESDLGTHLRVARRPGRERISFFLRAESYYNVATEVENIGHGLPAAFGGSPHERSHGESFLALLNHRFGPRGLYLLDEPEAALSPTGAMAVLGRMADLTAQGCQFVVATHSPILLALPGATILEIGDDGAVRRTAYDDAAPVVLTRGFLADPDAFLRHL